MSEWVHAFVNLPPILSLLMKISAILGVGWLLHLALRRANPRWQILVWRFIIVGLFLIPVMEMRAKITVPVAPPAEFSWEPSLRTEITEMAEVPEPLYATETIPAESVSSYPVNSPSPPPNAFSLEDWFRRNIYRLLIMCWALGVGFLFVHFIRLYGALRILRRSTAAVTERPARIFRRVQQELPCPKHVELLCSPDVTSPFLTGFFKPVVIIPRQLIQSKYTRDLPGIFAHELSHVVARDLYWMAVIRLVRIVLWFHPFVWRLGEAHNRACEKVSDTRAAEFVGNADTYSSTLARVALQMVNPVHLVGGVPMARTATIVNRVRVLRQQIHFSTLPRRQVILSLVFGLLAIAGIGGLHFVYAAPEPANVPGQRVLHFPQDRSLGLLMIRDARTVRKINSLLLLDRQQYYLGELWRRPGRRCNSRRQTRRLIDFETTGMERSVRPGRSKTGRLISNLF